MRDDILIALRRMRRKKASALAIVFLLALAVASVGCVFAVAYGLLWKPLPYPAQERLVQLNLRSAKMGIDLGWSAPYLDAVAKGSRQLEAVVAYRQRETSLFDDTGKYTGTSEVVSAEPGLFELIGARAALGRTLSSDDAAQGADPVAVIGWNLWKRQYGQSPEVLQQRIQIGGQRHRIVGVLPQGSGFPESDVQVWLPLGFAPEELAPGNAGSFGNLRAVGRLKPQYLAASLGGEMMGLVRSDTALKSIADEIDLQATARSMRYLWIGEREASLKSILLAVFLVFIVTTANACSLFMLRMLGRRQELALLEAVGATAARRSAQTVYEAALLSACAVAAAAAMIPVGLALLRFFDVLPAGIPQAIGFDAATVAAMAAMWAVATAALAASGLSWRKQNVYEVLRQTGNGQTASQATHRARQALVVAQIAATFVLLVGTALLMRSSHRLLEQDVGFDRSDRLVGTIQSARGGSDEPVEVLRAQIAAWLAAVRTVPGVESVALSTSAPFSRTVSVEAFHYAGPGNEGKRTLPNAYVSYVSSDYAKAMGLPLIRGRGFNSADADGKAPIALIDEDLAKQYFGDADPIGKTIRVNDSAIGELVGVTVVGVVGRVRQRTLLSRDEYPSIYLPETVPFNVHGIPTDSVELIVKADRPAVVAELIRARMSEIAPAVKFGSLITMERRISDTIVQQIRLNQLLQILAAITVLLTAVGLYALLSSAVVTRHREFGIRMALGASAEHLMRMVFGQSGRMLMIALGLGLPLALLLGAALKPRLFGISFFDPVSLIAVAALLLLVQIIASAAPARRASKIKPMEALRNE
ncbi:ABC transporter permease [Pseudomonas sp. CGJS7]|uniref:ABC transporter permease n=1 Tax=Pseudomonas sp. CGJS7 TaxID=3109348 RepID=UPI00300B79FD